MRAWRTGELNHHYMHSFCVIPYALFPYFIFVHMVNSLSPTNGKVTKSYHKHYVPLESDPEVFDRLSRTLGVSCGSKTQPGLQFHDIFSLDDPDLLAMIPRPVHALILAFPTTEIYEQQLAESEATRPEYRGSGYDEDVVWFKQTINNACGLYGLLHAVSNGKARNFIGQHAPYVCCEPSPTS
jgi:ubiquitin carboxyl-terminal hydrolase L3